MKGLIQKYGLRKTDICDLFVRDRKDKAKLFVDEGVYTKNRHFRLLGSSKAGKNAPLRVSASNKYEPAEKKDYLVFLDSLVTYFSVPPAEILEFGEFKKPGKDERRDLDMCDSITAAAAVATETESPHSEVIDKFILSLISPKGKIRKKTFFASSFTVLYDVRNYRYCHNIGREHKSNNVKLIVDLNRSSYRQKCYDPDCGDFKSEEFPLPEEIRFLFQDDSILQDVFFDEDSFRVEKMDPQNGEEMELCEIVACIEDALHENWL